MRLLQFASLWFCLHQTPVLANYSNDFMKQFDFNGKSVELFVPFSLCGMLEKLSILGKSYTDVLLEKRRCIIGCVNKTSDAFRIGIYACDGSLADFALPISFTGMDFMVQYSDAQFIAKGQTPKEQLYLQLVPNLACLQNGQNAVCIRVTKYDKLFERLVTLSGEQLMGIEDIGINRSIWKKASMNNDANVRSVSVMLAAAHLLIARLIG